MKIRRKEDKQNRLCSTLKQHPSRSVFQFNCSRFILNKNLCGDHKFLLPALLLGRTCWPRIAEYIGVWHFGSCTFVTCYIAYSNYFIEALATIILNNILSHLHFLISSKDEGAQKACFPFSFGKKKRIVQPHLCGPHS